MDEKDRDAVEHGRLMEIVKTVGWFVLGMVAVISISAYGCERMDAAAQANKPPCKVYNCVDH